MSLHALCERSMRTGVASRRIGKGASSDGRRQQLRPDAQRLIGRMTDAEHPLVAAHRAHAAAHLVGQGLEAEPMIRFRQRTGHRLVRALRGLRLQEDIDRLLETALQQIRIAVERNEAPALHAGLAGQVKAVDVVEEKQRPHTLVQVVAGAAESIQLSAFGQQFGERRGTAERVHRAVAHRRIRRGDNGDELSSHSTSRTNGLCQSVKGSSRSARRQLPQRQELKQLRQHLARSSPLNASASWAVSRPYLTPTS